MVFLCFLLVSKHFSLEHSQGQVKVIFETDVIDNEISSVQVEISEKKVKCMLMLLFFKTQFVSTRL